MTISAHLLSPMHPITAQQCNQCSSSDILLCAACAVVPPGYFTFGTGAAAQLRVCAQGSYAAGWVPIRTKCTSCGTNVRTEPQDPNEHMDSPALVATSSDSCSEWPEQTWGDPGCTRWYEADCSAPFHTATNRFHIMHYVSPVNRAPHAIKVHSAS
jgi:hypothetical protein